MSSILITFPNDHCSVHESKFQTPQKLSLKHTGSCNESSIRIRSNTNRSKSMDFKRLEMKMFR